METKYQKNPDEIGALWGKVAKNGLNFMSGYLELNGEKIKIVVFSQKQKSEKSPTHIILKSKEQRQEVVETEDLPF